MANIILYKIGFQKEIIKKTSATFNRIGYILY